MKKQQKFYKVVQQFPNGSLHSAIPLQEREVTYSLNTWTFPRSNQNQFLYVFNNRQAARNFKRDQSVWGNEKKRHTNFKIFECSVMFIVYSSRTFFPKSEFYYASLVNLPKSKFHYEVVPHTSLAQKVILRKLIY